MNDKPLTCFDCAVWPGQPHQDGCDVAPCTACGQQRIGCEHRGSKTGWGAVWTGNWPGVQECLEYGVVKADGQADLNRFSAFKCAESEKLFIEAGCYYWSKKYHRFICEHPDRLHQRVGVMS